MYQGYFRIASELEILKMAAFAVPWSCFLVNKKYSSKNYKKGLKYCELSVLPFKYDMLKIPHYYDDDDDVFIFFLSLC